METSFDVLRWKPVDRQPESGRRPRFRGLNVKDLNTKSANAKRRRPLYEVAKAAKVSPATVSRVAAGSPAVGVEIREHVLKTAMELGVDLQVRRNDKNRTIAFLLGNREVLHTFQSRILSGAANYCSAQNWGMLFFSFHYGAAVPAEMLHLPPLLSRRANVRGVILAGINSSNMLQALQGRGIPFAVLGNYVTGNWEPGLADVVYSDDIQGAYEATRHLLLAGHKNVCYIGNLQLPWFNRCAEGYRSAMAEVGLPPRCTEILSDGQQLGYLGTKSLLSQSQPVSAILAGSDQVAKGVYDASQESNISIPRDLSAVGFNDTEGGLFYPPLTSVRAFPEELGRHLAEFMLNRIENPSLPPQRITIPTQLIVRASVQAPEPAA
jgi:DNA-binding LacI/PurR family transcriptional regulator